MKGVRVQACQQTSVQGHERAAATQIAAQLVQASSHIVLIKPGQLVFPETAIDVTSF